MRLIDADALVSKCWDYYVEQGPDDGYIGTLKTLVDMQQTVEAYGWEPMDPDKLMAWMMLPNAPKPEWISVKKKMPEKHGYYLTLRDGILAPSTRMRVYYWTGNKDGKCWRGAEAGSRIIGITHWMPLPEPPRDEGDEAR